MHLLKKISCIYIVIICTTFIANAQPVQWTWVGGNKLADQKGNYGIKGVAAATNYPGARTGSIHFSDKNGNIWVFGGSGIDAFGNGGLLNDLWKWDGNNWTWVSGTNTSNNSGNRATRGSPNPANVPGARQSGAGGMDNNGNIWIFGGAGLFAAPAPIGGGGAELNDIWKFDGNNWTWFMGGDGYTNKELEGGFYYCPVFGTQGVAAVGNHPGVRKNCLSWTDKNGNFWIYGGYGYPDSTLSGGRGDHTLSDLWKWDGNNWAYISGSKGGDEVPQYSVIGAASSYNTPGGRSEGVATWIDKNGIFWLFGGNALQKPFNWNTSNDLWKFDGNYWTWVSGFDTVSAANYGVQGIASPTNNPGSRLYANGWTDSANNIWIFGGTSVLGSSLNDLWKWDGINWTWINGSNTTNQTSQFGIQGKADSANTPGARWNAIAKTDKFGKLQLFGGSGPYNSNTTPIGFLNDQWSWDGKNWTWLNGFDTAGVNELGIYGTLGIASPNNFPAARSYGTTWTDTSGNFWLFGGEIDLYNALKLYNDLWKYDGKNWTWKSGSNLQSQPGKYGLKGIASPESQPGPTSRTGGWTDKNGNLYLYGGFVHDTTDGKNSFIDIWKWDGSNWAWLHERKNDTFFHYTYPPVGVTDTANFPPFYRSNSAYWSDKNDNFWMYGGMAMNGNGILNMADQWKWDGKAWTLIYRSPYGIAGNTDNPIYGIKGTADPSNNPGSRDGMVTWKDSSDNIWMFGGRLGYIYSGPRGPIQGPHLMNDLWLWDGKAWTWIYGSNKADPNTGNYGILGVPSSTNLPSERMNPTTWISPNGNLWLFGGYGLDANHNVGILNDLWVWNGKNWTWMSGSNTINQLGVYGTKGIASSNNIPSTRHQTMSWIDRSGNAWLFGGLGELFGATNYQFVYGYNNTGYYNDLWKFNANVVTAVDPIPVASNPQCKIKLLNNPSNINQLQFISDQFYQKLNWQIFDEYGKSLQQGDLQIVLKNALEVVSINHLEKGVYFIKFQGDKKSIQTFKWIRL